MFIKNIPHLVIILLLGVFIFPIITFASITNGTISNTNKYAWGNNVGWINLGTVEGNVHITNTALTGYMWDSIYGWVNLSPTGSGVTNNGNGNLSGFAWSAGAGFIDFTGVTINSSGVFAGTASGVTYGQINFSCTTCSVVTDWRPVSLQSQSSGAVGPVSPFIKKEIVTPVSTSTESVSGPTMSFLDFIGYLKNIITGKKTQTQTKSPSVTSDNSLNNQPRIDTSGIPTVTPPQGKKFVTATTTENIVKDDIFSIIKKVFETILKLIDNLPGSTIIKSIIALIIIILVIVWRIIKKKRQEV